MTPHDKEAGEITGEREFYESEEREITVSFADGYYEYMPYSARIRDGVVIVGSDQLPKDVGVCENFAAAGASGTVYFLGGAQAAAAALTAAPAEPAPVEAPAETEAPAEAPAETEVPAEEPAVPADSPASMVGAWDEETFVYTNDYFGVSYALDDGWYYYTTEGLAENQGWEESSGVSATEYLAQRLADGGSLPVMYAASEDVSKTISMTVTKFNRGYDTGADATADLLIAQYMNMSLDRLVEPGTITIGGREYDTVHYEYERNTDSGTVPVVEERLCVANSQAQEGKYVLIISMTAQQAEDVSAVSSFLTVPADG